MQKFLRAYKRFEFWIC